MQVIMKELELPKELTEVCVFVVELLRDVVDKKPIAELTAHNLPRLMLAVQGFEHMGEELKDDRCYDVAALLVSDIIKVFKKKADALPPEAPSTLPEAPKAIE